MAKSKLLRMDNVGIVVESLDEAVALFGGGPLHARHLLLFTQMLSRNSRSEKYTAGTSPGFFQAGGMLDR